MEAMWHILFGKEAYFCPSAPECYCKKWGLCDLDREESGWCLGRVWVNPSRNPPWSHGSLPPHLPVSCTLSFLHGALFVAIYRCTDVFL
jgi:hypothetical protein